MREKERVREYTHTSLKIPVCLKRVINQRKAADTVSARCGAVRLKQVSVRATPTFCVRMDACTLAARGHACFRALAQGQGKTECVYTIYPFSRCFYAKGLAVLRHIIISMEHKHYREGRKSTGKESFVYLNASMYHS